MLCDFSFQYKFSDSCYVNTSYAIIVTADCHMSTESENSHTLSRYKELVFGIRHFDSKEGFLEGYGSKQK